MATAADRTKIYELRHRIYAHELGQHAPNMLERLTDALDDWNCYIVVKVAGSIAGFISITPPSTPAFSIDKYFRRDELLVSGNETVEIRLLSVLEEFRRSDLAMLLVYSALRWTEAHGYKNIVAIGRKEIIGFYLKCGLRRVGKTTQAGRVTYELIQASAAEIRSAAAVFARPLRRARDRTDWRLPFEFDVTKDCVPGGGTHPLHQESSERHPSG